MTLYRISIEIFSKLQTPLKGDTIWGHIACGIANHEGSDGVNAFINMEKPLVVSSAFPHGLLPKPQLPPQENSAEFSSKQEYTQFKHMKKAKYISASSVIENFEETDPLKSFFKETSTVHVSVSRSEGSAIEGLLFAMNEQWPNASLEHPLVMDVYVSSELDTDRILTLFKWAFEFGFGADATSGAGVVKILPQITKIEVKPPVYKRYLALGPFILASDAVTDLRGTTFVRKGKIGGLLAKDISPYKKSVILFDEGATFVSSVPMEYVGCLLHEMHSTHFYDICQSAFAPVIEV